MSLSIGIVGLPNVGKSTLFNALTKKNVLAANYPFATIEPSTGVVPVPDDRLDKLSNLSQSEKTLPAIVEFVDIAGLVKGAAEGEGLGNKFLQNIRETDAIAQMVRIFEDDDIVHVSNKINPLDDIKIINWELCAADVETVLKHRDKIQKYIKRGDKDAIQVDELLDQILLKLQENILITQQNLSDDELATIKHLHLLTAKPFLYILNKQAGGQNLDDHSTNPGQVSDDRYQRLLEYFDDTNALFIKLDASTELEINELDAAEKSEMRRDMEIDAGEGIDELIKQGYNLLGLMTYFTTGEKETRGWTVKRGSTAPEAAAAIHTDFQKNFIRAEVIEWDKLLEAGSKSAARDKGWLRLEGKDYIVQDGDVVEFKT
jgi:GTP-binding protein YchF